MGILDGVPADPTPIRANIDFTKYSAEIDGVKYTGEQLSTMARGYFATNAAKFGITGSDQIDLESYFAQILFKAMKEDMILAAEKAKQDAILAKVQEENTVQEATREEVEKLILINAGAK